MRENSRLRYHGKRLMEMIEVVVKSVNNFEVLDVVLFELGARHYTYGVEISLFIVCIFNKNFLILGNSETCTRMVWNG